MVHARVVRGGVGTSGNGIYVSLAQMSSLKTPSTLVRCHSSLAGPHLNRFVDWLEARGSLPSIDVTGLPRYTNPYATSHGPTWPSQLSVRGHALPPPRIPVLRRISVRRHATAHTSVEPLQRVASWGVVPSCLQGRRPSPYSKPGRHPHRLVSRLVRRSLALRPACSPSHPIYRRSDSYRMERPVVRAGIAPAGDPRLGTAHCYSHPEGGQAGTARLRQGADRALGRRDG
jgi:hypothetical protein